MWPAKYITLLPVWTAVAGATASKTLYKSSTWTQNNQTQINPIHNGTFYNLSSDGSRPSIIILDYGKDVEGIPTFRASQRQGDTSRFEITYSESRSLLDSFMVGSFCVSIILMLGPSLITRIQGDGPLALAAAMDTYRMNRYNITVPGIYTNELIQGGLRYQKLNLSTAGEIQLSYVGLVPATDNTPISQLPGSFNCSDPELTRIWKTGARTIQLSQLPARSIPEFWKITHDGAFVHSAAPQPWVRNDLASTLMQYTLAFFAKPTAGGFGFTVLSNTLGRGIFIFVDAEHRSISAHAGSTERDSAPLASTRLNSSLSYGAWHTVTADVNMTDISVFINGSQVLKFSQTSSFLGTFDLGASFGQAVFYENVSLTTGGQEIYRSSFTNKSAVKDFLTGTNPLSVSVDGSRRDRIAYDGDLETASLSVLASTNGREYINGSLNILGSFQLTPGFFSPTAKVQQPPRTKDVQANITGLIGYRAGFRPTLGTENSAPTRLGGFTDHSSSKRHLFLPTSGRPLAFSNTSLSAGFAQKVSPYASGTI
jgi:hypothetical protein